MTSVSNSPPVVAARFLLAAPFLIASATTFVLLKDKTTSDYLFEKNQPLISVLGEYGKVVPPDKFAVLLAVMQGLGGFLMVFNHKFGGALLMLYLIPVTFVTHQFWKEQYSSLEQQQDVVGKFLKNVAIMGGILMFMATTDEVPLKVKRKPHAD